MTESLDNVEVEISITVKQSSGYEINTLASTKQTVKGTMMLDDIAKKTRDLTETCCSSVITQLTLTQQIKQMQKERTLELENGD